MRYFFFLVLTVFSAQHGLASGGLGSDNKSEKNLISTEFHDEINYQIGLGYKEYSDAVAAFRNSDKHALFYPVWMGLNLLGGIASVIIFNLRIVPMMPCNPELAMGALIIGTGGAVLFENFGHRLFGIQSRKSLLSNRLAPLLAKAASGGYTLPPTFESQLKRLRLNQECRGYIRALSENSDVDKRVINDPLAEPI